MILEPSGSAPCSAANCCGLIEASPPDRSATRRRRSVPQQTAAASLKLGSSCPSSSLAFSCSAANSCGLIEASSALLPFDHVAECSAADCCGLIEAHCTTLAVACQIYVFRSKLLRPH